MGETQWPSTIIVLPRGKDNEVREKVMGVCLTPKRLWVYSHVQLYPDLEAAVVSIFSQCPLECPMLPDTPSLSINHTQHEHVLAYAYRHTNTQNEHVLAYVHRYTNTCMYTHTVAYAHRHTNTRMYTHTGQPLRTNHWNPENCYAQYRRTPCTFEPYSNSRTVGENRKRAEQAISNTSTYLATSPMLQSTGSPVLILFVCLTACLMDCVRLNKHTDQIEERSGVLYADACTRELNACTHMLPHLPRSFSFSASLSVTLSLPLAHPPFPRMHPWLYLSPSCGLPLNHRHMQITFKTSKCCVHLNIDIPHYCTFFDTWCACL